MSAPNLIDVREVLSELHYVGDGGGEFPSDLPNECERILRWLLNEYLRRGTHVCNEVNPEADRVA